MKKKKQIGKVAWPAEIAEMESMLADPEQRAWGKLIQHLNNAVVDPVIRRTQASLLAQFVRDLMNEVQTASVEDFLLLLESRVAEARAKQKGLAERAWVQDQWKQHSKEYESNKSAFARDYAKLLKNEKKYGCRASHHHRALAERSLTRVHTLRQCVRIAAMCVFLFHLRYSKVVSDSHIENDTCKTSKRLNCGASLRPSWI